MKLLHTADLHIENETDLVILEKIIGIAENENCDHILISGDMFENGRAAGIYSPAAGRIIAGFSGKIWVIPGNHDENLPEVLRINNGFVFDDIALVSLDDDFDLLAIPYMEGSLSDLVTENCIPESEKKIIAMMHGTLYKEDYFYSDMESNEYFPVKLEKLEELDFYYTAFGHYHSYYSFVTENGIILNPGSPVSTRKSDYGRRAVAVFDTETASVKKMILDTDYYDVITIDVNLMMSQSDILNVVSEKIGKLEEDAESDFSYLTLTVYLKGFISMDQNEQEHLDLLIGDILSDKGINFIINGTQLKTVDKKFMKDPTVKAIVELDEDDGYRNFALAVLSDIYSSEL